MLNKLYPRTYQQVMRLGMKAIKIRKPALLEGENSLLDLPQLIHSKGIQRVLIVTDKGITTKELNQILIDYYKISALYYNHHTYYNKDILGLFFYPIFLLYL